MLIFKNAGEYIGTCKTRKEQIAAIEAIQTQLLVVAATAATNGDVSQYSLNDGKTIIQTTYRTVQDVMKSYEYLDTMLTKLRNQGAGRMIRLVDKDTFNGSGCH